MLHMKKTTVRELHLKTSSIISAVDSGEAFVIEKRGRAVAELRPLTTLPSKRKLPDREKLIARSPRIRTDSGRILEDDRA